MKGVKAQSKPSNQHLFTWITWKIPVSGDCVLMIGKPQFNARYMKRLLSVMSVCLTLCGCAHQYVITLDSGRHITTASKPKLKGERYFFKDASGKVGYVSAGRVREIAPASMVNEEKGTFNPQPSSK